MGRNKELRDKKVVGVPGFTKTGTTICAMIFDGGVMLAADTRSTMGTIVGDKNCEKIHYLTDNMYCCGAGTAADCDWSTTFLSSDLELFRLNTGRETRIATAVTRITWKLFRHGGY